MWTATIATNRGTDCFQGTVSPDLLCSTRFGYDPAAEAHAVALNISLPAFVGDNFNLSMGEVDAIVRQLLSSVVTFDRDSYRTNIGNLIVLPNAACWWPRPW